jgi:dihydrofolate reductase
VTAGLAMIPPVVSLIVAVAEDGVIGRGGALPWRLPEDLKWFKSRTMGKPIIMGRKTWESFPKRPLPGRTNIIVTRNAAYKADGGVVVTSLDLALEIAGGEVTDEIMVIGGAELYALALPRVQRIYLTEVAIRTEGDAFFPALDRSQWRARVEAVHSPTAQQPIGYRFIILEREDFLYEHA